MKNLLVIILSIFLIFSCSDNEHQQVNLTSPKTAYSILTIIADQKGFFLEKGVDVKINWVNTGKIALDDLIGGNADVANIVETNVAFAGFLDPNLEVFGTIEKVYDAAIVARKDKGIGTPQELSGKKLGILLSTTSQVFADRFLTKHDIPKGSVEFVNLLPPAMQSAIVEGSGVDAISIWQPYVYNVQQALGDSSQVTFIDNEIFTGYMTISGKRSFAEDNPETITKLMSSYIEAEIFVRNNPSEAKQIVSNFLNLPITTLENIWDQYDLSVSFQNSLVIDIQKEGEWIINTVEAYKDRELPDYSKFFNDSYLKSARRNP